MPNTVGVSAPGPAEAAWRSLNPRQQRFVQAYLRCYNATKAAIAAGYSENRASAKVQGSRLMARRDISDAIIYGMGTGERIAAAQSVDAIRQLIRVSDDENTKPALKIRCCRIVLQVAGALPVSRPRRLHYNGIPLR